MDALFLTRRAIASMAVGVASVGLAACARNDPIAADDQADRSRQDDPLPSWNEGPAKSAIVDFVGRVTAEGGADFVPAAERIAVFDNDGTLWSEQPLYFQLAYALDRIKAMKTRMPYGRARDVVPDSAPR